jgi:hypothetical protein
LLTAAVLLATPAQASHSISAIGALATGVWYLAMGIIGFGLLVGLVVAYLSPKRKQKGIPIYVWLPLILFTLLVFYRFTHPRLELETAVIVGITLLFHFASYHLLRNRKSAQLACLAMFAVSMAILLSNPVILSFKNYRFSDLVPITGELQATDINHPVFNDNAFTDRLLQTSDGALYYGERFYGPNYRKGALMRETASACDNACKHCSGNCFDFFAVRSNRKAFARPTAIIDFQSRNNFPEGEQAKPFALINIPLEDEVVNPFSKALIGTLKQVRNADRTETWNPASYWLWSRVCGGGMRDDLAKAMIEAGADPNFAAQPDGDTTFNCALRSRSPKQIRLLARHGADPNIESRANRIHYPHPNAMFLVMHRYMELDDKLRIFKLLIRQGVDLNARHEDGETLLHRIVADAYLKDREQLTRFMLSAGVNARARRDDGVTALDLAKSRRARLIKDANKSKREQQDLSDLNKIIALLGRSGNLGSGF